MIYKNITKIMQPKCGLLSHLAGVVLRHYLAKRRNTDSVSFYSNAITALPDAA